MNCENDEHGNECSYYFETKRIACGIHLSKTKDVHWKTDKDVYDTQSKLAKNRKFSEMTGVGPSVQDISDDTEAKCSQIMTPISVAGDQRIVVPFIEFDLKTSNVSMKHKSHSFSVWKEYISGTIHLNITLIWYHVY
ncbi:hypothetical protein JTB14_025125 [Gonioctena quinquepunctata]|nr:hypothetical protein JTB14_025125 [Gonioctena quinquepunctata]